MATAGIVRIREICFIKGFGHPHQNELLSGLAAACLKRDIFRAMKPSRPLDTSPDVERVQIEIFRRMSPEKRLQLAVELTNTSRKLLAEGVRLRHPEYDEEMVRLAVIRLILPEELFLAVYPRAGDILP